MDLIFTDTGQFVRVHDSKFCEPPCCIHSPSEHHMNTWPLFWNARERTMMRQCEHGVNHPDPDDLKYTGPCHDRCDGCCFEREKES